MPAMAHRDVELGPPPPLARSLRGRRVAGVCAGIARTRGVPLGRLRAAFVVAALLAGLGVLVYGACWLIIPAEGEAAGQPASRGVVVLAQAAAALAGLATLGALAAAATIFGFGWVVLVAAAALLVAVLVAWPRLSPGWALLPLAAIAGPALAMAAGNVHLAAQSGDIRVAPGNAGSIPRNGYRSGLGTLLVDLRHTGLPARGVIGLPIDAGIRRTIVALPHDRCVHVDVDWHVRSFAARLAGLVTSRSARDYSGVLHFGQGEFAGEGGYVEPATLSGRRRLAGPTLAVRFRSAGGSLFVRDYPDGVDPRTQPNWPGFASGVEPRPDTRGMPRGAARRLIAAWRLRSRTQARIARRTDALMPGPCWQPRRHLKGAR